MKDYVYLVNYEYYGEWAMDCGACDYIGVYKDIFMLRDKITSLIIGELLEDRDRIIQLGDKIITHDDILEGIEFTYEKIKEFVNEDKNKDIMYLDVYIDKEQYELGCDSGVIVIKKMEVNSMTMQEMIKENKKKYRRLAEVQAKRQKIDTILAILVGTYIIVSAIMIITLI